MRKNFRKLIEDNWWLKKLPTTLTICNSLCGFAAILYSFHVYECGEDVAPKILSLSACVILGAMFFDVLDGFTARIFNAASMHGMQMDSLADMVTFGVAPAVLVSVMAHKMLELQGNSYYFVWVMSAIYLGCAALRLATYNVHAILEKKNSDKFSGLPSPGAAAAICSLVIYYGTMDKADNRLIFYFPIYTAVLGFLMVSPVKYVHMGKMIINARKSKKMILMIFAYILLLIYKPADVIVISINLYVLIPPVVTIFKLPFKLFANSPKIAAQA
jgi:CDP-diacylglycerol--serine O-phosphatidyltransferase